MRWIVEKFAAAVDWVTWRLWGRRRAIRNAMRLVNSGPPSRRENDQIYRTIGYDDMNLDHYRKIAESAPKEVIPPPRADDTDLN